MSRSVTLVKGKNNMIGISIGGGAPMCPVLYVVQVRPVYINRTLILNWQVKEFRTHKTLGENFCGSIEVLGTLI